MAANFTETQGQYLAYIYYYTRIHRCPPAEGDIQFYFRVSGPAVHQMIVKLCEKGLISRIPGAARTIEVLVPSQEIPPLI